MNYFKTGHITYLDPSDFDMSFMLVQKKENKLFLQKTCDHNHRPQTKLVSL